MYVYEGYIEGKKGVRGYSMHMENTTMVIQEWQYVQLLKDSSVVSFCCL